MLWPRCHSMRQLGSDARSAVVIRQPASVLLFTEQLCKRVARQQKSKGPKLWMLMVDMISG